jgi:hypothetical protein
MKSDEIYRQTKSLLREGFKLNQKIVVYNFQCRTGKTVNMINYLDLMTFEDNHTYFIFFSPTNMASAIAYNQSLGILNLDASAMIFGQNINNNPQRLFYIINEEIRRDFTKPEILVGKNSFCINKVAKPLLGVLNDVSVVCGKNGYCSMDCAYRLLLKKLFDTGNKKSKVFLNQFYLKTTVPDGIINLVKERDPEAKFVIIIDEDPRRILKTELSVTLEVLNQNEKFIDEFIKNGGNFVSNEHKLLKSIIFTYRNIILASNGTMVTLDFEKTDVENLQTIPSSYVSAFEEWKELMANFVLTDDLIDLLDKLEKYYVNQYFRRIDPKNPAQPIPYILNKMMKIVNCFRTYFNINDINKFSILDFMKTIVCHEKPNELYQHFYDKTPLLNLKEKAHKIFILSATANPDYVKQFFNADEKEIVYFRLLIPQTTNIITCTSGNYPLNTLFNPKSNSRKKIKQLIVDIANGIKRKKQSLFVGSYKKVEEEILKLTRECNIENVMTEYYYGKGEGNPEYDNCDVGLIIGSAYIRVTESSCLALYLNRNPKEIAEFLNREQLIQITSRIASITHSNRTIIQLSKHELPYYNEGNNYEMTLDEICKVFNGEFLSKFENEQSYAFVDKLFHNHKDPLKFMVDNGMILEIKKPSKYKPIKNYVKNYDY